MMTPINAAMPHMKEIEIFGVPALFTPHKVDRAAILPGMHCYEIQTSPFTLLPEAEQNFYGTVLTPIPLELPDDCRRRIEPGDFLNFGTGFYTIAEFEAKYLSPSSSSPDCFGKGD